MTMRAKDFLRQIQKLDAMIKNKIIEAEQWKAIASGKTAQMGGERVQSSSSQQKMADAIARYVDMEDEINRCIDRLIDAKKEVIGVIEQLEAVEYDLLHMVYVQNLTLYDAADRFDKSYSWVTTIHGKALKEVQEILDERET